MDYVDILESMSEEMPLDSHTFISLPEEFPKTVVRGKLRIMIGLPRSGKSTWATKWMRSKPREEHGIVFPRAVVSADSVRLAVTGQRFNKNAESTVFMVVRYMIESLLSREHDVVYDETNTTGQSIKRMIEIDEDASWTLINTPKEVCQERAIQTGQPDLVPVIERCSKQLQSLLDAGISQIFEITRQDVRKRWPKN